MTRLALLALTGIALTLAACEGGGDPVEQAMRDASAERQAATVKDGEVSGADHAAMGHNDALEPEWEGRPTRGDAAFRSVERAMHDEMLRASGQTVDQAYVAKMIAHHEGAVAMAEVALRDSRDPEIRRMAQAVVDAQTREIAEMRAWRPAATPPAG